MGALGFIAASSLQLDRSRDVSRAAEGSYRVAEPTPAVVPRIRRPPSVGRPEPGPRDEKARRMAEQ